MALSLRLSRLSLRLFVASETDRPTGQTSEDIEADTRLFLPAVLLANSKKVSQTVLVIS